MNKFRGLIAKSSAQGRRAALLMIATTGIGAGAFFATHLLFSEKTVGLALTQEETCAVAQNYAAGRLMAELYSGVTQRECGFLSLVQGAKGVWSVTGGADATQYGAPMRVIWTANAYRGSDGSPQVCAFALTSHGYVPRALRFAKCA